MSQREFDFQSFVEQRRTGSFSRDGAVRYAYAGDHAMMRAFSRMRPVELAAAAVVRTSRDLMRNQLLGQMVKVGPRQFPSIHRVAAHCAKTLDVPTPTLYIRNHPFPNAYTYGTDEESFIVIHSSLIDHFDEDELAFVIGHEVGHIQNKHVVYGTALQVLTQTAGVFLGFLVQPAIVALQTWYRRAEITCDRAGLLCNRNLDAACRSFLKLATGSFKLYDEMNLDAFLEQLEEGKSGLGQITEAFASHPYLPKRIEALRIFAASELYRDAASLGEGGLSMEEVDERTSRVIQIVASGEQEAVDGGPEKGDESE